MLKVLNDTDDDYGKDDDADDAKATTKQLTINPLSKDRILNWSKLKQIADDILKCI